MTPLLALNSRCCCLKWRPSKWLLYAPWCQSRHCSPDSKLWSDVCAGPAQQVAVVAALRGDHTPAQQATAAAPLAIAAPRTNRTTVLKPQAQLQRLRQQPRMMLSQTLKNSPDSQNRWPQPALTREQLGPKPASRRHRQPSHQRRHHKLTLPELPLRLRLRPSQQLTMCWIASSATGEEARLEQNPASPPPIQVQFGANRALQSSPRQKQNPNQAKLQTQLATMNKRVPPYRLSYEPQPQ